MKNTKYWFPVRPAGYGWGWGLPIAWQGWIVYLLFFALLIGGIRQTVAYGGFATIGFGCLMGVLLLLVMLWKGEPQSMRYKDSPPR